jgi:drug/metabolite transporter (DMT)-like permease
MMPDLSPFQKSAGAFICAAVISVPLAWVSEHELPLEASWRSLAATATMGVFATALAGTVMFRLIHSAGPSFLSLSQYLIPIYVVALGAVALGEDTSARELVALGLVISGIALSEWHGPTRPVPPATQPKP